MKQTRSISQFRRSFRLCAKLVICGHLLLFGLPASAQTPSGVEVRSEILVIDQDRLFAETQLGSLAREELELRAQVLAEENKKIEAELIAREQELTALRPTMDAQDFRALADEFDQRVERLRSEQDEKARELNRAGELARQNFFQQVAGVISQIVVEKGAVVVIDRRNVFLSADRIDLTDEAIARVNELSE